MKFLLLSFALLLTSCSTTEKWKTNSQDLTIMTYNVENLFDTVHDKGKNDIAYLPKKYKDTNAHLKAECESIRVEAWRNQCLNNDWTKEVVAEKMKRLKDVIMGVKNGQGPDILLMQEVENINVLNQLNNKYLQRGRYKPILIEGPDVRGIDTAILSRLPLVGEPKLHILDLKNPRYKKNRPTRGILQATFKLPHGQLLTVFCIHFPSQGGPTILRKQALAILEKITQALPKNRLIIVGGDFNITTPEDYKNKLLDTYVAKHFYISHRIGLFNEKGTEVYRGHWSFLDMLYFSKNMFPRDVKSGWVFIPESLRIPKHSIYQVSRFYSPNRFNPKSGGGVSDHYPVAVDLRYKSEAKEIE